jgi:hypothetical protein
MTEKGISSSPLQEPPPPVVWSHPVLLLVVVFKDDTEFVDSQRRTGVRFPGRHEHTKGQDMIKVIGGVR